MSFAARSIVPQEPEATRATYARTRRYFVVIKSGDARKRNFSSAASQFQCERTSARVKIAFIRLVASERTAAIVAGSICLILTIGMFVGWRSDGALRGKLKESGKKAEASVVAAATHNVATGRTSVIEERTLSVIFMADLKMISKDFRVTERGLIDHPQGSKVAVLYDPENPEDAILDEDFALSSASTAWIGGTLFAVLTLLCFGYALRARRR